MSKLTREQIEIAAKAAHEANRAYCEANGDDSQLTWDDAPDWQRESAMAGVKELAENPMLTPAAMHESWMQEKIRLGWTHGEVKDPVEKTHPCLLPYRRLPAVQRAKDHIFRAVVLGMIGHPDTHPSIPAIEEVRSHLQSIITECQETKTSSRLTVGEDAQDPAIDARMDLAVDILNRLGHAIYKISGEPARG